jgi:hypothetical protein
MTTIEIIGGSAAAVIGLGAYLRRGTMPVVLAYRICRDVERPAANPVRYGAVLKIGYSIGRRDRKR